MASTKATAGRTGTVIGASWDNSNDTAVYHVRCSNDDMIELTHAETVAATLSFRGSAVATTAKRGGKVKAKSKGYNESVWQHAKKAQAEIDVRELDIEENLRQDDGQTGRDRNQGRRHFRRREKRASKQTTGGNASEDDDNEEEAPSRKKAKGAGMEEKDLPRDDMDVELSAQVMAMTAAGEGGGGRGSTGTPSAESVNRVEEPNVMIVEAPHQAGPPPSQAASTANKGGSAPKKKKKKKPRISNRHQRRNDKRRDNRA